MENASKSTSGRNEVKKPQACCSHFLSIIRSN